MFFPKVLAFLLYYDIFADVPLQITNYFIHKKLSMKFWASLFWGLLLTWSALAQPNTEQAKLKKALSELDIAQKQQVLEYARHFKELDLDDVILRIAASLSPAERKFVSDFAQLKANGKTSTAGNSAEESAILTTVSWDKMMFDFGDIEEGKFYIGEFKVTNTGTQPLVFTGAKARCDCTVTDYPQYPIAVGASAIVRVEFNSSKKLGILDQGIVLYDNSAPNMRSILYLRGLVMSAVR